MNKLLFIVLLLLPPLTYAFDHSHQRYDELLQEIVTEIGPQSVVDYDKLKANPEPLTDYLKNVEAVATSDFQKWTENQQLAFLINAYNAFTLKLIVDNYPGIDSIRDLGGFLSSPWKQRFFTLFGEKSYLDYIEHEVLRKHYQEPRIHFAVNCASKGCPPLQKRAYVATQIEMQLEQATVQFMRDPSRNRYNPDKNRIEISSIFKWFQEDFTKNGSVQNYVSSYISADPKVQRLLKDAPSDKSSGFGGLKRLIKSHPVDIHYLDYDWSLNTK